MLQWPQATIYSPDEDSVIAYGHGMDERGLRPDTFRLDLANPNPEWQALDATGGQPSGVVCCTTAVYDSLAHRMILIGGGATRYSPLSLQRVWMLDLASGFSKARWASVETTAVNGYPEARSVPAVAFMPQFNWVVVFGGLGPWGSQSWSTRTDTWILDLNAAPPEWRRLATTGETHQLADDLYNTPNHAQVSVGGADVLVTTGTKSSKLKLFGLFCRSTVTPFQFRPQEQPGPQPSGSTKGTRGRLLAASGAVDLAVSRVETDGSPSVRAGARSRTLSPCIRNLGSAAAPRFTVRADDGVTWTAPGLGAGQELCLEPKASRGRAVTVDPDDRVREADEANNTRAVTGTAAPATGTGRVRPGAVGR